MAVLDWVTTTSSMTCKKWLGWTRCCRQLAFQSTCCPREWMKLSCAASAKSLKDHCAWESHWSLLCVDLTLPPPRLLQALLPHPFLQVPRFRTHCL